MVGSSAMIPIKISMEIRADPFFRNLVADPMRKDACNQSDGDERQTKEPRVSGYASRRAISGCQCLNQGKDHCGITRYWEIIFRPSGLLSTALPA